MWSQQLLYRQNKFRYSYIAVTNWNSEKLIVRTAMK